MDRAEHLAFAKERAIEYCDQGDSVNALASFISDMKKHDELANHSGLELMGMLMFGGHLNTTHEVRKFVLGFN